MSRRCQCPFSGPADTILGCHRDPITSEKGWLDFAVRELSRVAAGKARGQEAVWRSQCKPAWWDGVCASPWKNPTANPKDSKDTLKAKFECLVQHLRKMGQLPKEMGEEISLWEEGRVSEVFLMTSYSSLLGQASNLHTMLHDTCHKMENCRISVAPSILTDLHRCVSACADKIEATKNMTHQRNQNGAISSVVKCADNKRLCQETDTDTISQPPHKRSKRSPPTSPFSSSSSLSPHLVSPLSSAPSSSPPPPVSVSLSQSISVEKSKMLLAVLQKQLLEKKMAPTALAIPPACTTSKTQTVLKPKSHPRKQSVNRLHGTNHGDTASTDVGMSIDSLPSLSLFTTTAPQCSVPDVLNENTKFIDFLELELEGNDNVADCQFYDSLLQKKSPDISVNASTTCDSFGFLAQPVSCCQTSENRFKPDPFFGHAVTTCDLSESSSFPFDDVAMDAVVVDSRWSEGGLRGEEGGTALFPGVGDMQNTEVVGDSGYNSESSITISHRSYLDYNSDSASDLDNPDLEAYLESLL